MFFELYGIWYSSISLTLHEEKENHVENLIKFEPTCPWNGVDSLGGIITYT